MIIDTEPITIEAVYSLDFGEWEACFALGHVPEVAFREAFAAFAERDEYGNGWAEWDECDRAAVLEADVVHTWQRDEPTADGLVWHICKSTDAGAYPVTRASW